MILTPVSVFNGGVHSFRHTVAGYTADDSSDGCACDGASGSSDSSHSGSGCSTTGDRANSSPYKM